MKKINRTTLIVLLVSLLLLGFTSIFGALMVWQSRRTINVLIRSRMLDVTNAAAAMLDGDVLGSLTAEDTDTPEYQQCLATLRKFQDNIDLSYIYAIKQLEDGSFVFSIDPDPDNPAEFGETFTAATEALWGASRGTAGADDVALEDEWGRSYSSYSPVFGSDGSVKGIVGVDFDADWIDEQISRETRIILISSVVSLVMGVLITLLITASTRRRLAELNREIDSISADVGALMQEIRLPEELRPDMAVLKEEELSDDELTAIRQQLAITRRNLHEYIDYLHSQSYLDVLTGIGNRTSYLNQVKRLESEIQQGCAAFSLVIMDVNNLKGINDTYGHEEGDRILIEAGRAIRTVFGAERVFRIGGDEFAALPMCTEMAQIQAFIEQLQAVIARANEKTPGMAALALSCGTAVYDPGRDRSFREVFERADRNMYREKAEYYETHEDRRRSRT